MFKSSFFTLAISALLFFGQVLAKVPHLSGWKLIWHDDFNVPSGSRPSKANWIFDTGHGYGGANYNWGTGEIQYYTASRRNLFVHKGILNIRPIRDDATGTWTSARIETRRKDFHARPGHKLKIQARIAMPSVDTNNGKGYWGAFWTLGSKFRNNGQSWPWTGEFDIAENVNGQRTSVAMHCGQNPGGPCNEPIGLGGDSTCRGSACNGNWHTYSVVIDRSKQPERLRFFTDGVLYKEILSSSMDAATWASAVHTGRFILLNVAMGGQYPNGLDLDSGGSGQTPTAATVSGRPMRVRYVAVYEQ